MERFFSRLFIIFLTTAYAHAELLPQEKKEKVVLGQRLNEAVAPKARELILMEALKDNKDSSILHFLLARVYLEMKDYNRALIHFKKILLTPIVLNNALMRSLLSGIDANKKGLFVKELIKSKIVNKKFKSSCPFFELERRKDRVLLLEQLAMTMSHDLKNLKEIWHELYTLLPETMDESLFDKNKQFNAWKKTLSLHDVKQHIGNLLLFGKNDRAKDSYNFFKKNLALKPFEHCDLDYEGAKILRKMRRYKDAQAEFTRLFASCHGETRKKARFMELKLRAQRNDKSALKDFDDFVAQYPTDTLSDDVLLFKSSIFIDNNENKDALKTLDRIINEYKNGDMIEQALFKKAFILAALKQNALAIGTLKELDDLAKPHTLEKARALYWRARLSIFSDLFDVKTKKDHKEAKKMLTSLVGENNPTIYSLLAYKLLLSMGEKPKLSKITREPNQQKNTDLPSSLSFIKNLIDQGLKEEALALLNEIDLDDKDQSFHKIMASLYVNIDRPDAGHQKLIRCDEKKAELLRSASLFYYDQLGWPTPFIAPVNNASKRLNIPASLIYGIIRQESAFFKDAHSWAQARGPMQLMKSTAEEEAKRLKLEKLTEEDLFDPKVNILLGTSALKNYMRRFGHVALALCAYNAGPSPTSKWLRARKNIPLDTFIATIPYPETRSYVEIVLSNTLRYNLLSQEELLKIELEL